MSDCHRVQAELKAVDLLNNVSFRSTGVSICGRLLSQLVEPAGKATRKWPLQDLQTSGADRGHELQASRFGGAGCVFDRQRHHLAAFSMCGEVCSFACGELPPTNAAIGDSQFLHRFAGQGTKKKEGIWAAHRYGD